jgi:iron complex outermembrane receptor protein
MHPISKNYNMTFAAVPNSAPALKPLALACAISLSLLAGAAHADEAPLTTVRVTGARFPSDAALPPVGATVITAEEIRSAGANDVNAAIRKIGGVYGRQGLTGSPDFSLDLRGFGTNSAQNMVILVDGVRLNENELTDTVLATIPVDTVERIEIVRGGSSVLYGEGATGGVINIITKRGAEPGYHGSVVLEGGQRHQFDTRASLRHGEGPLSFDIAADRQGNHNDRANAEFRQKSVSGGVQWAQDGTRVGLRVESARQDQRFPGSLTIEQFEQDPHQTNTPTDFGTLATDRVTAFAEQRIGSVELAAELSHREREVSSNYDFGGFISESSYQSRQTQFSPRLRQITRSGALLNEIVAGVDLTRWERDNGSGYAERQRSSALYLRDEMRWDRAYNARLALGARHEKFKKDTNVVYEPGNPFTGTPHGDQSLNAWTVEGSIDPLAGVTVHAKAGQSYRIPNVDENGYRASIGLLGPQTSRDLELGVTVGDKARQVSARVFRHRLRNEIFYVPFTPENPFGANTNLDPTRRQGVELDAAADLPANLRLSGHLQHVQAEFTDGPNAGREMVLVPKNVLTARLAWLPGNGQSADIGVQYVAKQRYGSDFGNDCNARIPSYTTLDARYAVKVGSWEFAVNGLNLADREYFSQAFGCRSAIYPSDGRQVRLSARYDF